MFMILYDENKHKLQNFKNFKVTTQQLERLTFSDERTINGMRTDRNVRSLQL
jgi:hypothetical protein